MVFSLNDFFAICFIVGLTIVYLPQFYKIYRNKSSFGFSPWFVFMGYCGSFLSWINGGIFYIDNWRTCHGGLNCTEHLTGILLIIFQWLLFLVFYVLVLYYYKNKDDGSERDSLLNSDDSSRTDSTEFITRLINGQVHDYGDQNPNYDNTNQQTTLILDMGCRRRRRAKCCRKIVELFGHETKASVITYFITAQLIGLISLGITIGMISQRGWTGEKLVNTQDWSKFLGAVTTFVFCLHYLPQIYQTIKLGRVGSLSLVTLGIMCPGTFVWTYFLANQSSVTSNSPDSGDPSIWVPFLCVGILQAILLGIGIYYEWRNHRLQKLVMIEERIGNLEA